MDDASVSDRDAASADAKEETVSSNMAVRTEGFILDLQRGIPAAAISLAIRLAE
jgi:hypothetical protein